MCWRSQPQVLLWVLEETYVKIIVDPFGFTENLLEKELGVLSFLLKLLVVVVVVVVLILFHHIVMGDGLV